MNEPQDRPRRREPGAHRHGALRTCLALVAAMQAGAILVNAPTWTPGRAAVAVAALGLGALAALTAVVLMGTRRPIGKALAALLAVALAGSWLGPTWAATMRDPTQARIPDLELSVRCEVSADMQSVTAIGEFRWHEVDLGPGLAAPADTDSLAIGVSLPESLLPKLQAAPPDASPGLVRADWSAARYWQTGVRRGPLTTDGRPSWPWYGGGTGSSDYRPNDYWDQLGIGNGALRAGAHYSATWTLKRNHYSGAPTMTADQLPIFMVEYRHRQRFAVQAFGSCADPNRSWPNRFVEWSVY
jgi:hypothetical protein